MGQDDLVAPYNDEDSEYKFIKNSPRNKSNNLNGKTCHISRFIMVALANYTIDIIISSLDEEYPEADASFKYLYLVVNFLDDGDIPTITDHIIKDIALNPKITRSLKKGFSIDMSDVHKKTPTIFSDRYKGGSGNHW